MSYDEQILYMRAHYVGLMYDFILIIKNSQTDFTFPPLLVFYLDLTLTTKTTTWLA
jgi:hypothetical protein